jgi:uncharacterized protein (TIGR00369 family)
MKNPDVNARVRTVQWDDPALTAQDLGKVSGIEFLRRIASGERPQPPIARLLGFRLVKVEKGFAMFEIEPAEFHYNPIGVVHGGVAGTLLDSALGCAVQSTLPAGMAYTTLEYKVNLVRAITAKTGKLRAEARVVHAGSRIGTAEGRLVDLDDKVYAHGTTTCLIVPLEAGG